MKITVKEKPHYTQKGKPGVLLTIDDVMYLAYGDNSVEVLIDKLREIYASKEHKDG